MALFTQINLVVLFVDYEIRNLLKAYKEALKKHIKYLKKLGFNCDDNGRIQLTTSGGYYLDIAERTMRSREKTLSDVPMSNKIGHGGTKPDNSWKIEASKNFTIY